VLRAINAPTPHARVTLDKRGVAFHGGAAQLHGTYSCTHADSFAGVTAHLYQRAGRLKIQADGSAGVRCNGKLHHWSARLVSPIGTYAKGPALARVRIISCGLLQCRQDHAKRHVDLAWSTKPQRAWMAHPTTARQERPSRVPARQHSWPGGR
jgi:Family of unknown function (DUF6299)